jgi:integrase/recombinase XerD
MKKTKFFFSPIGSIIKNYLDFKRSLGREYKGIELSILKNLDKFLCDTKSDLTLESFTAWCLTHQKKASGVRRSYMRNVRNLCLYRQRTEPACFVPDILQFPPLHQPVKPHIFTEDEIVRLFNAIKKLNPVPSSPVRRESFRLALVLLYTTGLRRGELTKLTIGDYNVTDHTLLIRASKFHKSRLIPLSSDGWNEIENYLKMRKCLGLPISKESSLIWNNHIKKRVGFYSGGGLGTIFRILFRIADIRTISGGCPRLHDIRHSFAVHVLLNAYRNGENVQAKLPILSTYMGHVSVVSTQYYLRFIEDVVGVASTRFEKRYGALVSNKNNNGGVL